MKVSIQGGSVRLLLRFVRVSKLMTGMSATSCLNHIPLYVGEVSLSIVILKKTPDTTLHHLHPQVVL